MTKSITSKYVYYIKIKSSLVTDRQGVFDTHVLLYLLHHRQTQLMGGDAWNKDAMSSDGFTSSADSISICQNSLFEQLHEVDLSQEVIR